MNTLRSLIVLSLLTALPCPAATSVLQNGGMDDGGEQPEGWKAQGVARMTRDTAVAQSAPASMRIEWENGSGGVSQLLDPRPSGAVTVKGAIRMQGDFEMAQVALQCFDASRHAAGWLIVAMPKPSEEWKSFEKTVTIPEAAAAVVLVVVGKGTGTLWVDDLAVEAEGSAAPSASAPAASAPTQEASPLPVAIPANDPHLHYSGRFDTSDPQAPRCAWPASAVTLKFEGTAANVRLTGQKGTRWQAVVDGQPGAVLVNDGNEQRLSLAQDLPPGEHTIKLVKMTEALLGRGTIHGFEVNEGAKLLDVPEPARRIEVIGDSISAGFGNEASDQHEKFSAQTENANIAYGALAAKALGADYACIAWSGKKLWPDNTIVELYDRIIPQEAASAWDFSGGKPDVVVINLGTNDVSAGDPDEEGWVKAYKDFIGHLRANYPDAFVFCAVSPMLADKFSKSKSARTTITRYLNRVADELHQAGDAKVAVMEFPMQTGSLGFGAAWHPSARQHEAMGAVLEQAIREKVGW